ncbi:MAG: phosphatase PAP2 family protein [Carnobacterium sp.]|uniref:phosphatase PAP2 family protein n=1 Tax=Carnobacterium sp. TaxID=48221 RepID=UPI002FC802B9
MNSKKNSFSLSPWLSTCLLLLLPFSIIASSIYLNSKWIISFDQLISKPILASMTNMKTAFFISLTDLGGVPALFLVVSLCSLFLIWHYKDLAAALWFFIQSALGAGLLNQFVKLVLQRERPTIEHLVVQGGYSFPSGHSMGSLICYGGLAFLFIQFSKNSRWNWLVIAVTAIIVFLIGMSRIYVGVHFPSDVIGGYCLGGSWLALSIGLYPKWKQWTKNRQNTQKR